MRSAVNSPGNRRSAFRRDFCHGDILGVAQRAAVLIEVVSDPFAAHAIKLPCRRVIGKCELEHGVQFADVRWLNKANERFDAAVRMYEAANGAIELPGQATKSAPAQQPADQAARVAQAVAKAQAEASGPSTLSDIPGGQPAAHSQGEAMLALSGSALTDHFMGLSPDELEAQLARLSS